MILNYELIILILFITIINITIGLNNINKTDLNYLSTNKNKNNNNESSSNINNNNNDYNNHNINNILYLNLSNKNLNNTNIINLNKLINLQYLDLSINNIKNFNLNFNKIKFLNLYNNNLVTFNNNLIKKKIVFINLSCNKIININNVKFYGNNLEIINLSYNFITTLINTNNKLFFNIKNLKILILSNNKIDNLINISSSSSNNNNNTNISNSVFYNLNNLEILDLSSNNITVINNDTFVNLINLQILDLSYNNLVRESLVAIQLIPNLIELSVAYNRELGSSLQGFVTSWSLKEFDASGTGLTKIPYALTQSVRTLRLNDNLFETIQCGDLDSYPLLQILELSSCNISEIEDDAFGRLEILQELHLNDNHLISIPISLPSNIEYLYLQYNNIINIDGNLLQQLLKLKLLNLEGNSILYLPELPKLPKLFYINLKLNNVKGINLNLINNLPNLKELNVNNNPIKCSDLNQIAEWVLPCRNILLLNSNNNNDLYSFDDENSPLTTIQQNHKSVTINKKFAQQQQQQYKCINYNKKSINIDEKVIAYLKLNRILPPTTNKYDNHSIPSPLTTATVTTPAFAITRNLNNNNKSGSIMTATTALPITTLNMNTYNDTTNNRSSGTHENSGAGNDVGNEFLRKKIQLGKIEFITKLKPDINKKLLNINKQQNNANSDNHINGSDIVNLQTKNTNNYKNSNSNNVIIDSKFDTIKTLKTVKNFKLNLNTQNANSNNNNIKFNNLLDMDKLTTIENEHNNSSNNNHPDNTNNNTNSNNYHYRHHNKINTEKLNQTINNSNNNNNNITSNYSNATSYSTQPEKWNEIRTPQTTTRHSLTFIVIGATIGIILSISLIQIYRCIKPKNRQTIHHTSHNHPSSCITDRSGGGCSGGGISSGSNDLPASIIFNRNRYNFNDDDQYNPVRRDLLPMESLNLSSSTSYLQSQTNILEYW